jgi:hypothetical protein
MEEKTYDVVIFDEMALIRRSFLASTMKKVLNPVLQNMRQLVASAKLVVLAQDEFSCDDVGFYTIPKSVDPEDRNYIFARQFTKQVVHHPVEYTEKIEDAISNLINAYRRGMDGGVVMTAPFVVYCSAVKTAEYIVTILRYLAPNDEARDRIMRRATDVVVEDEASLDVGTEIWLPPCPFIDGEARERDDASAEDEEGFNYISDMTEATY